MLCKKPFRKGVLEYGCGQCLHCRINRSRMWVGRMLLESMEHPASSFVTLTYNEKECPHELVKKDLQDFFKRLRAKFHEKGCIRYFAVGEYGEQTWRPHYHCILFGFHPNGVDGIDRCWKKGFVHVGEASVESMSYVSGYVIKKMTKKSDPRLKGRAPEFAVMSLKPAIGSGIVERIVAGRQTREGQAARQLWREGVVQIGRKRYPLGYCLKRKVQVQLGVDKKDRKEENHRRMMVVAGKKMAMSTVEYERKRKARVQMQSGRYLKKGRTL